MDLIERLNSPAPRPARSNRIERWIETLPDGEAEAVRAAAINRAWQHSDLLTTLVEEGMPEISDNAFGKWRRKMGWKP